MNQDLTEQDFLNAMEQTKLNQHDIIKILNQKNSILENQDLIKWVIAEKNTLTKEIEAAKDVINIQWNEKQELCKYIDQLKRSHQNIAESIAKILGVQLNYD